METMNAKVGDDVAVQGRYGYSFGKIKTITPSGQVVVTMTISNLDRRFNRHGYETGRDRSSTWACDRLVFNVAGIKTQLEKEKARKAAAHAINMVKPTEIVRDGWSKESMQGELKVLEERLARAKALVEAL